jgi:2-iminobutanoate/2-iminopropanoate deaminase
MNEIRRNSQIDGIPEPTGPFHWTAEWNGLAFISGVRGIDPLTGQPAKDDARRLDLIFEHLRRILESVGSSLDHVLSSTVYVTDMNLRPMVNDAYVKAFGSQLPTRTIVQVAALNQDDSIEIAVIAAKIADIKAADTEKAANDAGRQGKDQIPRKRDLTSSLAHSSSGRAE